MTHKKWILGGLAAVLIAGLIGFALLTDRSELDESVLAGTVGGVEAMRPKTIEAPADAAPRWRGPDGALRTDKEVLDFLSSANIVSTEAVGEGITKPKKVLLEKDGQQMSAIFHYHMVDQDKAQIEGRYYLNFRDRYIHQKAAYQLAQLIGLQGVPPVVLRRVKDQEGSLQIWIEQATTEKKNREEGIKNRGGLQLLHQRYVMELFDALIYNVDRNQGNMLYDADGNLLLIDHTRSFVPQVDKKQLAKVTHCERSVWERLQAVGDDEIRETLEPYLEGDQISGVVRRREKLVRHFQKLIEDRGEERVLFSL